MVKTLLNMNTEQFNSALNQIESEATRKKIDLLRAYQKYKIGDLIYDSYDKIIIERIEYNTFYNDIAYYGRRFTKSGLSKLKREAVIWQKNANLVKDLILKD